MKKRKLVKQQRVSGVPVDAKLVAEAPDKTQIYIGKDGAVYGVRFERVTYRLLGGA